MESSNGSIPRVWEAMVEYRPSKRSSFIKSAGGAIVGAVSVVDVVFCFGFGGGGNGGTGPETFLGTQCFCLKGGKYVRVFESRQRKVTDDELMPTYIFNSIMRGTSSIAALLLVDTMTTTCAFRAPRPVTSSRRSITRTTSLSAAGIFESSFVTETSARLRDLIPSVERAKLDPSSLSIGPSSVGDLVASAGIHLATPAQLSSATHDLFASGDSPLLAPWYVASLGLVSGIAAFTTFINTPDDYAQAPYPAGSTTYDPNAASDFYASRPFMVLKRILRLSVLTGAFNIGLLYDWLILGKLFKDEEYTILKRNEPRRAKEALLLCTKLGPTFIKLGQALSIRTDIVPEAYALELRQLQDAVPPFDDEVARSVLKRELGVSDIGTIFEYLSESPVASASIGQVYRGTLRTTTTTASSTTAADGGSTTTTQTTRDVAVKVQRPGILGEIALDLHVLRLLTPIQTTLQNAINGRKTDTSDIEQGIALVDEWGRGFVAETDYRLEATNTIKFEAAMRSRKLDAVCAPNVIENLVRDKVLVTEWVTGTRLDKDASTDVPRLCGVAINAYLTMLLDTGVLQ